MFTGRPPPWSDPKQTQPRRGTPITIRATCLPIAFGYQSPGLAPGIGPVQLQPDSPCSTPIVRLDLDKVFALFERDLFNLGKSLGGSDLGDEATVKEYFGPIIGKAPQGGSNLRAIHDEFATEPNGFIGPWIVAVPKPLCLQTDVASVGDAPAKR